MLKSRVAVSKAQNVLMIFKTKTSASENQTRTSCIKEQHHGTTKIKAQHETKKC